MTTKGIPFRKRTAAPVLTARMRSKDERYELEKRRWKAAHADATPREYEQFIAKLTQRLGL